MNQAGPHRVQHHISGELQEVALLFYQYGLISALEEVSDPAVPAVEDLGVHSVQLPHASGEICLRGFYDEVVVVIHEAVGMADPVESIYHVSKDIEEVSSVLVIQEDGLLSVAPGGDMVEGTFEFYSQRPGHG